MVAIVTKRGLKMKPDELGFSLFELMVVILLFALLATVSFQSMSLGWQRFTEHFAIRTLMHKLSLARSLAIDDGKIIRVCFSGVGGQCSKEGGSHVLLFNSRKGGRLIANYRISSQFHWFFRGALNSSEIVFTPEGFCEENGTVYEVEKQNGKSRGVISLAMSGHLKLWK